MSTSTEEILEALLRRRGLKTWHVLLMADIISEKIKAEQPALKTPIPEIKVPEVRIPKPLTRVIDLKNKLVEFEFTVFESSAPGTLKELVLCSPSNEYSILLSVDGVVKLYKSWDEMQALSQYLETVDAFKNNEEYVLHLKDFSWLESAYSIISVKKPVTFSKIFVKLDELR